MGWKIWSRWRRRRPLISLSLSPSPPLDPDSPAYLPGFPLHARGPYPENAPGPFYVERDECISCGYPKTLAPDLIHFDENRLTVDHCYFKRQPETPDEVERAIKAVAGCCCGSYRYAGNDPDIKKRLKAAGCKYAIDHR